VVLIKSVTFDTPASTDVDFGADASFPDLSRDPFITTPTSRSPQLSTRPVPPPTAALVELPTCPVCLERMDSAATGLLTIPCQHVFHCDCLQRWRGSGCPVCRHIQPSSSLTSATPFGRNVSDVCLVCDCPEDLWICLICGYVGCGRYKGGHAKEHWKDSAHCFALEIATQYVWDYAGDAWVHRLIQTKGDGKLVELPSSTSPDAPGTADMVPRAKLEAIGIEYGQLLSSQLESQRVYFESLIQTAVGGAERTSAALASSEAAAQAEHAVIQGKLALAQSDLALAQSDLALAQADLGAARDALDPLQRQHDRASARAETAAQLARSLAEQLREERAVSAGLLARIEHQATELVGLRAERDDLREQNRDLAAFVSARDRLAAATAGEAALGDEVREAVVSVAEAPRRRAKGKR
jgi:BRCA1-associated protein